MNNFQTELYNDLMILTQKENSPFYYADHEYNGSTYRIFNYHHATYALFQEERNAVNCRGTMFELNRDKNPIALVCLPMHKFFNFHEDPMLTEEALANNTDVVMLKLDGSLISSYKLIDPSSDKMLICLKTKATLNATQVIDSENFLMNHSDLYAGIEALEMENYTVNSEWIAPNNRVVIGYSQPKLVVLNARNRTNGKYLPFKKLQEYIPAAYLQQPETIDPEVLIPQIPRMENIEGFVFYTKNDGCIKYKTEWYLLRHHLKETINNNRALFEACLREQTDDIRQFYFDDSVAMEKIRFFEEFVSTLVNMSTHMLTKFYTQNKDLSRKEYALKAQKEFKNSTLFPLAMNFYTNKPYELVEHFLKHWDEFKNACNYEEYLKKTAALNELSRLDQEMGFV